MLLVFPVLFDINMAKSETELESHNLLDDFNTTKLPLPPEKLTLGELQGQISDLEGRLNVLEQGMAAKWLESGKRGLDPSKFVSKEQMVEWVKGAISQGNATHGVSKSFIKKILVEEHQIEMNGYYTKKLNFVLQSGIDHGAVVFDNAHQLYKLAK